MRHPEEFGLKNVRWNRLSCCRFSAWRNVVEVFRVICITENVEPRGLPQHSIGILLVEHDPAFRWTRIACLRSWTTPMRNICPNWLNWRSSIPLIKTEKSRRNKEGGNQLEGRCQGTEEPKKE